MRKAFTLIELLAVIAIITLLIGILLPAVQAVREAGKRTQCINRQRNVAVALLNYENTKGVLPGWRDLITTAGTALPTGTTDGTERVAAMASWVYCILPQLEQSSMYEQLKSLSVTSDIPAMPILHCPSLEVPPVSKGTHYVVNGGAVDDFAVSDKPYSVDANIANGPFLDRALIASYPGENRGDTESMWYRKYFNPKYQNAAVRVSDISTRDGTAYTLMTSENAQRGYWIADEEDNGKKLGRHFYHTTGGTEVAPGGYQKLPDGRAAPKLIGPEDKIEGSVAFCWPRGYYDDKKEDIVYKPFMRNQLSADPPPDPIYGDFSLDTAADAEAERTPLYLGLFPRKTFAHWFNSARPSSMHVDVVIASFCDGNVRRLNTQINEKTFVQLMTVSDSQSDARLDTSKNEFLEGALFDPSVL